MQHCKGVSYFYLQCGFFSMLASPRFSPMLTKGVPI